MRLAKGQRRLIAALVRFGDLILQQPMQVRTTAIGPDPISQLRLSGGDQWQVIGR